MSIIGWIIIGAVAGWIASKITGQDDEMSWIENIIAGIVGALVGGFLFGILADRNWDSEFDLATLLVAIVGAVIVLFLYRAIRSRAT